jgi:hypothetical protein
MSWGNVTFTGVGLTICFAVPRPNQLFQGERCSVGIALDPRGEKSGATYIRQITPAEARIAARALEQFADAAEFANREADRRQP